MYSFFHSLIYSKRSRNWTRYWGFKNGARQNLCLVLWWVINTEKANNFMFNFDIFDNSKIEIWIGSPEYLWTAENWGYARQSFLDFIIMLIIKGSQSAFFKCLICIIRQAISVRTCIYCGNSHELKIHIFRSLILYW